MTDIPVLFQPEMVDGIDHGRKTMTRRLAWLENCNPSPWQKVKVGDRLWVREQHWRWGRWVPMHKTVPGKKKMQKFIGFEPVAATLGNIYFGKKPPGRVGFKSDTEAGWHKRPSIFMPKDQSRFTLIVTDVKIEKLHVISDADAIREGVEMETADPPFYYVPGIVPISATAVGIEEAGHSPHAVRSFAKLWVYINGAASWNSNPDVVAAGFRTIKANIGDVSPVSTHTAALVG